MREASAISPKRRLVVVVRVELFEVRMRVSPPDHGKFLMALELGGKPDASGMPYDPLQELSSRTWPVDCCASRMCRPIELGEAQRLIAVTFGEVVEAVEHGELSLSIRVIRRRVHVCPAYVHPLRSRPVVRPVGLCSSTG